MSIIKFITGFVAPLFIITSPITSYADQIMSIHRSKNSGGFSLDIPLIMLVASLLRVFYFPGALYDTSLLIQSLIMIVMQILLLKVALDHRPSSSSKSSAAPFSGVQQEEWARPFDFWKWKSPKPYWQFLLYLFIALTACELLLAPMPPIYDKYSNLIGYLGLGIEATLPLPQVVKNQQTRSCKGFRVSVLASWLAGDFFKMFWFMNAKTEIPLAFKLCGVFQMICDFYLCGQYCVYGEGKGQMNGSSRGEEKNGRND